MNDHRAQGTQVQRHIQQQIGLSKTEEILAQNQMSRTAHGEKFGQTLNHTQQNGVQNAHERVSLPGTPVRASPSAVASIPGFLLLRDLGLLNTFAALVLSGAASGMGIFILKGFLDSMPQELYEAATIDGAPEWRIFLNISLPLVTPILAVNALGAFLGAYSGWEWAIVVCQNSKLWTIAVWTYQFQSIFNASQPYTVMAAFVVSSIPVLLVFLFCQKIILRGIILPTMK